MSEDELVSQMRTTISAGYETVSAIVAVRFMTILFCEEIHLYCLVDVVRNCLRSRFPGTTSRGNLHHPEPFFRSVKQSLATSRRRFERNPTVAPSYLGKPSRGLAFSELMLLMKI